MKQYLIAAALLAGLSMPALAANQQQHYVVRDFTGYCAVLDSHPSPGSHLKIIGKGYDTRSAAEQALKGQAHCTT
jgi:hypothetical protein